MIRIVLLLLAFAKRPAYLIIENIITLIDDIDIYVINDNYGTGTYLIISISVLNFLRMRTCAMRFKEYFKNLRYGASASALKNLRSCACGSTKKNLRAQP